MDAVIAAAPKLGVIATCVAFGVSVSTYYRHRAPVHGPRRRRASPPRRLSDRPRVPERVQIGRGAGTLGGSRRVYFGQRDGWIVTPVLARGDLATPRQGPAIVEEYDATCVVPPGARASLDASGNIVMEV